MKNSIRSLLFLAIAQSPEVIVLDVDAGLFCIVKLPGNRFII